MTSIVGVVSFCILSGCTADQDSSGKDNSEKEQGDFEETVIDEDKEPGFELTEFIAPNEVEMYEEFEVYAIIKNNGGEGDLRTGIKRRDGIIEETVLEFEPGEEKAFSSKLTEIQIPDDNRVEISLDGFESSKSIGVKPLSLDIGEVYDKNKSYNIVIKEIDIEEDNIFVYVSATNTTDQPTYIPDEERHLSAVINGNEYKGESGYSIDRENVYQGTQRYPGESSEGWVRFETDEKGEIDRQNVLIKYILDAIIRKEVTWG